MNLLVLSLAIFFSTWRNFSGCSSLSFWSNTAKYSLVFNSPIVGEGVIFSVLNVDKVVEFFNMSKFNQLMVHWFNRLLATVFK